MQEWFILLALVAGAAYVVVREIGIHSTFIQKHILRTEERIVELQQALAAQDAAIEKLQRTVDRIGDEAPILTTSRFEPDDSAF